MFRGAILKLFAAAGALLTGGALFAAPALAQSGSEGGQQGGAAPTPGGITFMPPGNEMARQIDSFHDMLLVIITAICVIVLALLAWVIVRYNRAANPTARKFSHNTLVEIVWTVVPVLILVFIAIYSFPLLAKEERVPAQADLTIKAIGNAWFWQHEYPDFGGLQVTSNILPEDAMGERGLTKAEYRLAVDEPIVVPVGKTVRLLVTSNDVIHSWSVPSLGVKEDAIPGRVNEGWFIVDKPGTYYGFCQELCGLRHAFMPLEIKAVSQAEFDAWVVEEGGTLPGSAGASPVPVDPAFAPPEDPAATPAAPANPAGSAPSPT